VNATVVLPIVFTISALLTWLYLAGTGDLDDLLARRQRVRRDRAAMRRRQAARNATRPRVLP